MAITHAPITILLVEDNPGDVFLVRRALQKNGLQADLVVAEDGQAGLLLMDRVDVLQDWPGKKDSDIADKIFTTYGLTAKVEDTTLVHDDQVSTIIQRETDIQFLKRLALRNGYECFVDGDTGYFRPPQVADTPQPVLAVQFGDETNVNRFQLEVNALAARFDP